MASADDYTALITSEHADKPKFMAMVGAVSGMFASAINFLEHLPQDFDLDTAIGAQLDVLGLWIGISRRIAIPIPGVYFSWDTADVGWDQGVWKGAGDAGSTVSVMDDDTYRLVLRAKIGANNWDGALGTLTPILNKVFEGSGTSTQVVDNGDMSFNVHIIGQPPSALSMALVSGGYIPVKPVGVRVSFFNGLTLDGGFLLDGHRSLSGLS